MQEKINLRANYPVLTIQEDEFRSILDKFYSNYNNWLVLNPFSGMAHDRAVAAQWISGGGPKLEADRVSIATGGHHACLLTIIAAGLQNKAVAVEEFSYPGFMAIARIMNVKLIACKSDDQGMLPLALEKLAHENDVKGIYLMPTVNNPTGSVMPLERRMELIAVARKHDLVIIDDDAYGFLEDNPPANFAQLAPDLGWYVYSLSKPIAPDIKVAFMVSPAKDAAKVSSAIQLTTSNPSSFFTALVSEMITSGYLERLIASKRIEGNARQLQVRALLNGYEISAHKNGWHLWLELPEGISSADLSAELSEEGVELIPGSSFAVPGAEVGEYVRIALGGEKELEKSIRGIEIIKSKLLKD